MSKIKKYSLVVEASPEDLVRTVTKAAQDGWLPLGGIALTREPADPKRGIVTGRTIYAQAMFLPFTHDDSIGIINGR